MLILIQILLIKNYKIVVWKLKNPVIDTIKIAKEEFPGQTVNLDSLCRKLNVTNTRQDYHGALLDATLLSKYI